MAVYMTVYKEVLRQPPLLEWLIGCTCSIEKN